MESWCSENINHSRQNLCVNGESTERGPLEGFYDYKNSSDDNATWTNVSSLVRLMESLKTRAARLMRSENLINTTDSQRVRCMRDRHHVHNFNESCETTRESIPALKEHSQQPACRHQHHTEH
ncbi:hypothetical protein IG631_22435 [Alternaria alternata]|nr:hypothetical protein IG631_22435 [Alternaria alternata]